MVSALLLAAALSTTPDLTVRDALGPQSVSPWSPEVNAAIDSFGGVFLPPMAGLGYYRGGPRAQQRGFWVGSGQVGLDLAVMTVAFVVGNGTDFGCSNRECGGLGGPGALAAIGAYMITNTAYSVWSAYDAYQTVKQDPPLSTVGPIR